MVDIEKLIREIKEELEGKQNVTSHTASSNITVCDVPRRLEHSLLTVGLTREALLADCRLVRTLQVAAVCVAPYYVADAAEMLAGSSVLVCAAVGFPSAFMSTEAKAIDVRSCVAQGAAEIDLAMDIAAVKSGNFVKAEKDFMRAAEAAQGRCVVKAVFEHGSYDDSEKESVLRIIERSGVPYLKIQNMTSGHGARVEDIRFVRDILGSNIKIKIDGGVKTLDQAMELFRAGAYRIGLTATKTVAEEAVKMKYV